MTEENNAAVRDLKTDGSAMAFETETRLPEALKQLGVTNLVEAGALVGRDSTARELVMRLAAMTGATPEQRPTEEGVTHRVDPILRDYLDLSVMALHRADTGVEDLGARVAVLSDMARMIRAVPVSMRPNMEHAITVELQEGVLAHYLVVVAALSQAGTMDALEAERHLMLRHLNPAWLPPMDAELLKRTGYPAPEAVLAAATDYARSMPDRISASGRTLESVMTEGADMLQAGLTPDPAQSRAVRAKSWTGIGKILTGAALAGGNLAGGVLLGLGTAGVSVGVTWLGVVGSAGAGVGMVFEGVGAIRGE